MLTFSANAKGRDDPLEKEKREIEKRRGRDAERLARVKNPAARKVVVNVDEIAQQIAEKKALAEEARKRDLTWGDTYKSHAGQLESIHEERERVRKQRAMETQAFLRTQKKDQTTTWMINDPARVRNEKPPRAGDDDPAPACSFQRFNGEDLKFDERKRLQQQQIREWSNNLLNEKENARKAATEANSRSDQISKQHALHSASMDEQKRQLHMERTCENAKTNLSSASRAAENRTAMRKQLNEDLAEQVKQQMESDFLTEPQDKTLRYGNKNRYIPSAFKGFGKQKLQSFLDAQKQQVLEKLEAVKAEKAEEGEFAGQLEKLRLRSDCDELAKTKMQQVQRFEVAGINREAAVKHANSKEQLAKAEAPRAEQLSLSGMI